MVNRALKVIEYYTLCNKLKDIVRTGWLDWHVSKERVESIAEHIYGVQMLAIAMHSEYQYDIDLKHVIMMLAIHELEETKIGDLTIFDTNYENKEQLGHQAIHQVLSNLLSGEEIEKIILEFDAHQTPESLFAYHCDKLECDLQCKLYDEGHYVDFENLITTRPKDVQTTLKNSPSWSYAWMNNDRHRFSDDKNFEEVLDYAINNKISPK